MKKFAKILSCALSIMLLLTTFAPATQAAQLNIESLTLAAGEYTVDYLPSPSLDVTIQPEIPFQFNLLDFEVTDPNGNVLGYQGSFDVRVSEAPANFTLSGDAVTANISAVSTERVNVEVEITSGNGTEVFATLVFHVLVERAPVIVQVTKSMLDGEEYQNEKFKLFDEYAQVVAAPPSEANPYNPPINETASSNANTWRTPGAAQWSDVTVTNLNLDLRRDFKLLEIYLYDGEKYAPSTYTADGSSPYEVMGGTMEVYSGTTLLFSYPLTNEGKWVKFDLGAQGVTTDSLRFVKIPIAEKYSWWGGSGAPYSKMFTCDVNIAEVALYGIPLGEDPEEEEEWVLTPQEGVEPFDGSDITFGKFVGSNSFFDVTQNSHEAIGFIREYHYWNWTEWSANGQAAGGQFNNSAMTQNPLAMYNNVWGVFDNYYQTLKDMGVGVNIAFNSGVANSGRDNPRPNWQGDQDPKKASSYLAHGQSMFQHAARYGSNQNLDPNLVRVAPGTEKKIGMDLVEYYENWNEQNLWGHFTGAQFAAMTSADYDGHMGTMGADVGLKQADPNAKLVLGGFAGIVYNDNTPEREQSTREFFNDMMKWFDENRTEEQWMAAHNGSLEGYVRYPFDVLNGHFYAGEGVDQPNAENHHTSMSAEEDHIYDRMKEFVELRDIYLADKEIWLSEFGWDVNQGTESSATVEYVKNGVTYNQGINTGLNSEEVQGRWLVREYLMLAAAGIDRVQQYMMPDADTVERRDIRFNTSGMIRADGDNTHQTTQKRPSWYYVGTMKYYLDTTKFDSVVAKGGTSGLEGPWVLKFDETVNDDSVYTLWLPTSLGDQNGNNKQNYTLTLPEGAEHAYLVTLKDGVKWGERSEINIVDGKVTVSVSEKPVFVLTTEEEYYKPLPAAIRPVSVNKLTESNTNPNLMVDMRLAEPVSMTHEQATAAGTYWDPGTGDRYAIIDLGSEFDLSTIQLLDGPGTLVHDRAFVVYAAETLNGWTPNYGNETAANVKAQLANSNWERVLTYGYLGYLSWYNGRVDTKARYLIVGFENGPNNAPPAQYESDTVPVPEMIIKGSLARGAIPPEPFVRTFTPKPSQDEFTYLYNNEFDSLTTGTLNPSEAAAAGFSIYGANVTVVEGKNGNGETDGKMLKFQGTIKDPQFAVTLAGLTNGNYEPDVWYNIDYKFKTEDSVSAPTLFLTDGASGWTPLVTRDGAAKFKPIWGGSNQVTTVYRDEWHRLNTKFKINSSNLTVSYEVYYDDVLVHKADTTITDTLSRTKPLIIVNAGDGNTGVFYLDDIWVYRAKPSNNLIVVDFNKLATGAYTGGSGVTVGSGNNATVIQPNVGEAGYYNGKKVLRVDSNKTILTFNGADLLAYIKNHGAFIVDYQIQKSDMNTVPRFALRNNTWATFSLLNIQAYTGGKTYFPYVENSVLKYMDVTPTANAWHRVVLKIQYTNDNTLVYSAYFDNMTTPVVNAAAITTANGMVALPLINFEIGTTSGGTPVYMTDVSIYKGTDIMVR